MKAAGTEPPAFLLNNRLVSIHDAGVQSTLLDYIRSQGLTGAKEGCAEGECGACTVVLVAESAGGSEYRAVNSCLMLAPMAAGHEILTVEALAADGHLSEAQQAMAAWRGFSMRLLHAGLRDESVRRAIPAGAGRSLRSA